MLTFSNIREFTRSFYRIERSGTVFQVILALAKELLNSAFLQLGNTVLRNKYIFILVTTKYFLIKCVTKETSEIFFVSYSRISQRSL